MAMYLSLLCAIAASCIELVVAEDGRDAWLRYARLSNAQQYYGDLPDVISVLNQSEASPVFTAGQELQTALHGIFGWSCHVYYKEEPASAFPNGSSIVVGTVEQYTSAYGHIDVEQLEADGFWLDTTSKSIKIIVCFDAA